MNRAWIPAGALASVSVAGLIALGPLTDSLGTTVSFKGSVGGVAKVAPARTTAVPVSVIVEGAAGDTHTAALARGSEAVATQATAEDAGLVGFRKKAQATAKATTQQKAVTPPKAKPKVKPRQTLIGGTSGAQNGDTGLAGDGGDGQTNVGEVGSTPAP